MGGGESLSDGLGCHHLIDCLTEWDVFGGSWRLGWLSLKQGGSFLKKRTKKLSDLGAAPVEPSDPMNKSFLLLFFKKEDLRLLRIRPMRP
jgi:hypothetical protein